jgi:hypothetical protein
MAGVAVLLCDAEVGEQVFEAVAAAGEAGSVDRSIVSECGLRQAIDAGSGQEGGDYGLASDPSTGEAGEQVAGVVVELADDLYTGAVGELPMGEVRLPALVGLVGFESPIRAFRSLLRFRADQPRSGENTTDGGG